MANEGSTKPTYEELEAKLARAREEMFKCDDINLGLPLDEFIAALQAERDRLREELARVRGLLQRLFNAGMTVVECPQGRVTAYMAEQLYLACEDAKPALATFPQSSSQGAESADIGKLDAVDKSGKVNGVEEAPSGSAAYHQEHIEMQRRIKNQRQQLAKAYKDLEEKNRRIEYLEPFRQQVQGITGSAETGGEKAAPHVLIPRTLWQQLFDFLNRRMERDRWQNDQYRLREGLEDCADPNRLRGMDGCAFCMGSGRRVDDAKDICVPCECVRPARQHSDSFVCELEANFRQSTESESVPSGVEGAHEGTTADKKGEKVTLAPQFCNWMMTKFNPGTGAIYCNEPEGHEGQHRHQTSSMSGT